MTALHFVLAVSLVASSAAAESYVCKTPDGKTVVTYSEKEIPKDCGPVKVVSDAPTSAPDPFERYDSQIAMTPPGWTPDHRRIVGKLRNESGERFEFLAINFAIYNQAGEQIESPSAIGQNLDPHETWSYEAPAFKGAGAAKLVVKSIDRH